MLFAHSRDGDGAAEAVEAPDERVGGLPEVGQAGVSPGEGEREVALGGLTGHSGPAAQAEVRPELEGNNLGGNLARQTSTTAELEDTGKQVTGPHHHHRV